MLSLLKRIKRTFFSVEAYYAFLSYIPQPNLLNNAPRERKIIVSLTSIPSRLDKLHIVLMSLLWQSFKADKIVLWLSEYDKNGNRQIWKDNLPANIKRMQRKGVEINFVEDIRSYRKLIPALKKYPDAVIVTADDDTIYPKDWLRQLINAHDQHPNTVVCFRGSTIILENGEYSPYQSWPEFTKKLQPSNFIFPQGCEGILYPPGVLGQEVFNQERFLQLSPTADDVWFKAMSLLNDVPCVKITSQHRDFRRIGGSQSGEHVLHIINNVQGRNDPQIKSVFSHYELHSKLSPPSH